MADNADQINTNAQKPKRASIDGQSAEQHSIDDQIKADRYAAEQSAGSNSKPGIRLFQLRNKGTV